MTMPLIAPTSIGQTGTEPNNDSNTNIMIDHFDLDSANNDLDNA